MPSRTAPSPHELKYLAALLETTQDAIIGKNLDGIIECWNAAAERLYGYTQEEAIGCPVAMLVPPELRDEFDQIMESVRRGERVISLETERFRKDGSRISVALVISSVRDADGVICGASVIARDISERKRRDAELFKGRERLRAIIDAAVDAIISFDEQGVIQSINPATHGIFGYITPELIGREIKTLLSPSFRDEFENYFSHFMETGGHHVVDMRQEAHGLHKDGRVFPIDLVISEVEPDRLYTATIRDISERMLMAAAMRQSDRRATIGMVAAGLGHDLTSLLLALRANTDVLGAADLPPEGTESVESLRRIIAYLRDLAHGLHMVAMDPEKRRTGTAASTNLATWKPSAEALLKVVSRPGVSLDIHVDAGLPSARISPHNLTQIVFNLVGNASHAISDSKRRRDGLVKVVAMQRPDRPGVRIEVSDNGPGMPPEVMSRAMEPLFTTRSDRGGTGLGLALVKSLVNEVGGVLTLESEVGVGTTVTIDLQSVTERVDTPGSDIPSAVVSVGNTRASALLRFVLENAGMEVRDDEDVEHAQIWIVDPKAASVAEVKRWRADRPGRKVVLFGRPETKAAAVWGVIEPLTIEDPDDFESIRTVIEQAVMPS